MMDPGQELIEAVQALDTARKRRDTLIAKAAKSMSQREIARVVGLSQARVGQIVQEQATARRRS
jgi:DNA-directed RNA polymerase specialized sigma subunit